MGKLFILSDGKEKKPKRKRKGIHAKTKTSSLKTSINYKKSKRGQG